MENSRVTKFLLDRGARVFAILTSTNYCVLPLVQGGLEIPCRIKIHLPPTVKNKELIRIYESYVDTLYYQREEANIAGSFLESEEVPVSGKQQGDKTKQRKKTATKNENQNRKKDSSSFVNAGNSPRAHKTQKTNSNKNFKNDVVELSD